MGYRAPFDVWFGNITAVKVMCSSYQRGKKVIRGMEVEGGHETRDVGNIRGTVLGRDGDTSAVVW